MLRSFISFLALCAGLSCMARTDSLLMSLDSALLNRGYYDRNKQIIINEHKAQYESTSTPIDRYNTLRSLYGDYRSYRIDSAMIAADERLLIARQLGDRSKIASATLNIAEAYAKSGNPDKAISILDTLDTETLEKYHNKYRIGIYRTVYATKARSAILPSDRMDALEKLHSFTDLAARESAEGSLGSYTLKAEKLRDAGMFREAVAVMEEAGKKFDLSKDAAMQYTMGEIYLDADEREKAIECLARSAVLDISGGVKEYRALILLSSLLFENGDLERAFNYINCAFDDADFSRSYLRTAEIMKIMPVIDASFHAAERQINTRTRNLLILAGCLMGLLLISLIFIILEYRANKRMLATIADINSRLEQKNEALIKSDALKLQHLNKVMLAYAGHISRLRDFRKNAYRLLKTGQYENALDFVKSDAAESLDIASFHELFDDAFLSMFPDFVSEVNDFMEKPLKLKNPGRLTPELRVAAMIRLGMTSTEDIARLLHYSNQTVYNLRSSLKSMVRVPWEEFEAYLKQA